MVRKEDVDFYSSFSRKELQSLCKKYNLPANRSSMDMADSLASYFQRNSLNSGALGIGWIQSDSAIPLRAPASGTVNVKKDYGCSKLEIIRKDHYATTTARETGFTLEDKTHYQEVHGASTEMKDFLQGTDCWLENRTREVNTGERPQETPSPGCSTYSNSSSFEFHVSSEKGINLSVDLNFNPSAWINSMKNEVRICNSMRPKKFRSSDQGNNSLTECKKLKSQPTLNTNPGQCKDGHEVKEASMSPLMKENSKTTSDHQSSGEGSLTSSAIKPCSRRKDASEKYKGGEGYTLSIPESSAPDQIVSCAESRSKSCCVVSLDLDHVNSPGEVMLSDSVTVAGECPITRNTQEYLMGDLPSKYSDNPSSGSPQKVGNSSTVTPIYIGGGSEVSSSEANLDRLNPSYSPCKTSRSPNFSESKLIKDTESQGYSKLIFQYNAGKNCLASNVVEQEKSETLNGQELSELLFE